MKKRSLVFITLIISTIGIIGFSKPSEASEGVRLPILRVYNPNSGEHLFTPSYYEAMMLKQIGWNFEGQAFLGYSQVTKSNQVVERVYNPNAGDHHYTADKNEVAHLVKVGWKNDNIEFYTANQDGQPVYRLYNPNAKAGAHHFTLDANERNHLTKVGWKYEGVAFKAYGTY